MGCPKFPARRRQHRELWLRRASKIEGDIEIAARAFFREQSRAVMKAFRELVQSRPQILDVPGAAAQITREIFNPRKWDARVREVIGEAIVKAMARGYLAEVRWDQATRQGKQISIDEVDDILADWDLPRNVQESIKRELEDSFKQPWWDKINRTTSDNIQRTVGTGLREGWGPGRMARALQDTTSDVNRARGLRIARTEGTTALNAGQQIQAVEAETAGLKITKIWSTVGDGDVRDAHVLMEGAQSEGAQGLFAYQSEKSGQFDIPYPGFITLPVEDRANCRCGFFSIAEPGTPPPVDEVPPGPETPGRTATDQSSAMPSEGTRGYRSAFNEWDDWNKQADKFANNNGMTGIEFERAVERKLKDLLADVQPYMRTSERGLTRGINQGRFAHPIEANRGTEFAATRRSIQLTENRVLGVPNRTAATARPINAYLNQANYAGLADETGLEAFGDAVVKLKPGVLERSSVTFGQSYTETLGGSRSTLVAGPVRDPGMRAWHMRHGDPLLVPNVGQVTQELTAVEAQIHGGVRLADIAEVLLRDHPKGELLRALSEARIPYRVRADLKTLHKPWAGRSRIDQAAGATVSGDDIGQEGG